MLQFSVLFFQIKLLFFNTLSCVFLNMPYSVAYSHQCSLLEYGIWVGKIGLEVRKWSGKGREFHLDQSVGTLYFQT